MTLKHPFHNEVLAKIDAKYFPEVKWYHDNPKCVKIHYAVECLTNGVARYDKTIQKIAKLCSTTEQEIDELFEEFKH
jgi:prefoldin subunit 5